MIVYFISRKLLSQLRELKKFWNAIAAFLILLFSYGYGCMIAFAVNKALTTPDIHISAFELMQMFFLFIAGITLFRMIVPTYMSYEPLFPAYFPVSRMKKLAYSLVNDFNSAFFLFMMVLISSASLYLQAFQMHFFVYALSSLVSAHLFRRLIQYIIDFRFRKEAYIVWVTTLLVMIFAIIKYQYIFDQVASAFIIPLFLILALYVLEYFIEEKRALQFKLRFVKSPYLKLILNNPTARTPLLLGFVFKLAILVGDYFASRNGGKHLFDGQIFYWVFLSPLLPFTYVFNNIWGFWKDIWLNYELRKGSIKNMLGMVFKIMAIPLVLDAFITISMLLIIWKEPFFILLYYAIALIFLISFSFFSSIIFNVKVKSGFQMRGTTSFVSSIICMISLLLLSLIRINFWFYAIIPVLLILSVVWYTQALEMYKERKYKLYKDLYKD